MRRKLLSAVAIAAGLAVPGYGAAATEAVATVAQLASSQAGGAAPEAGKTDPSLRQQADDPSYQQFIARLIAAHPDLKETPAFQTSMLAAFDCKQFASVKQSSEGFADYLKSRYPEVLAELPSTQPYVRFVHRVGLGRYDDGPKTFPLSPLTSGLSYNAERYSDCDKDRQAPFPTQINVRFSHSQLFDALPVGAESSQAILKHYERQSFTLNRAYVEIIGLPKAFHGVESGRAAGYAMDVEIDPVQIAFFADQDLTEHLHTFGQEEVALRIKEKAEAAARAEAEAAAQAEAARLAQAEAKRLAQENVARFAQEEASRFALAEDLRGKSLAEQRAMIEAVQRAHEEEEQARIRLADAQSYYHSLLTYSSKQRAAIFVGSDVPLSHSREAIGYALIYERSEPVTLVVKADGAGTTNVATAWPKALLLDLEGDLAPLTDGGWYIVAGRLMAEAGNGGMPMGRVTVESLYECQQDRCDDLRDVDAAMRVRFPDLKPSDYKN